MPIPQSVLLTMSQRMKEGKKKVARDLDQTLKTSVFPAMGVAGSLVNMQNDQSNDPNIRTAAISGAVRDGAMGYQSGGIGGLLAGGITGGISSALVAMNRKEQNYETEQNKYLNDMYGSVVGEDMNLASLVNAAKGGEMNSAEGDQYVPIQTEAKKVGRKLIKEKLVFSDGTMSDVNATKPHSEMKKDEVTDIVTQGTYVFPVNTKITQKDLDFLITYTTGDYSENGKNFAIEEFTLRDVLGKNFEGSFAEAADIIDKKYPVADTEDTLDPVTKITNSENIANRSKIIAHLIRLNESKIKGIKLEENKIRPEMNAKRGGFVKKYPDGGKVDPKPKRKPIGVEPGDPRIKKYQDSLYLYKENNWFYENGDINKDLPVNNELANFWRKGNNKPVKWRTTDGDYSSGHPVFKKPVQPYVVEERKDVNINPLPTINQGPLPAPQREVSIENPNEYWGEKEVVQDWKGVPNIKIVQKERKSDGQLIPAFYENQAGERIPYNEKLTKEFQYKKAMVKSFSKGGNVGPDPKKRGIGVNPLYKYPGMSAANIVDNPEYEGMNPELKDNKDYVDSYLSAKENPNLFSNGYLSGAASALQDPKRKDEYYQIMGLLDRAEFETNKINSKNVNNKKMGGYVMSFKKGGKVIDPAKMKAEIQRINEERNNPSRTSPLAKMPEMGSVNDPVSNRVTGEYGNAASAYDSDKNNKEKYDAMVSAKNNYFNYMKSAGVGTGPNNSVAFRPKATSQDDYMVQNLKGLGMYDKNSDITNPNKGYSFWNTPAQKQNAIVNGGAVAGAPVDPNKTTAPVSKGIGTKPGGSGSGSGGGAKDWKDKAVTERWQRKLKAAGLYQDGAVDGMWGEKTNKAYAEYLRRNQKGSTTSPVSSPVPPVVAPVAPKSVSYVPGESTMKYTATDYNPTNNSNLAAPVSYFEQKGLPYSDVPDVIALRNANEMNATALTFAFPWLGYGQKSAAAATTGREVAKVGGREMAKAATKETTKEVAKAGTKDVVKTQAANNFARIGSGTSKGAGSFKNAATGAKAAMDSGAIKTSVEAIRNGILQARKVGNRAEVQRLMKSLEELRKSNPSAGIYKRGGYVMKMAVGGSPDPNPKGKVYKRKNEQGQEEEVLIGDDQNLYLKNQGGVYEKKDKKLYDSFMNVIGGGDKQGWAMLSNSSSGVEDIKKKDSTPVSAWSDGAPEYDPGVTGDLTGIPNKQQMYGTFPTGDKKSAWSDGAPEYDPTLTMDVQPKYQEMFGSFPSVYDMGPINTSTNSDVTNPNKTNTTTNTNTTNTNGDTLGVFDDARDMINERMTDAHRDAVESSKTYRDLAARTGARDLASAVTAIGALGLQNRAEPRAFKRARFMLERFRGLSPQQINQEAETATGAGVEAVKQMNRESGSMTSRLGSALMSRLTEQQGQIRKGYVDQNTQLERAKYNEYADIQEYNVGEEARAKRVEIDNGNKVIAGTQGVISKYLGSRNEADMANTSIAQQIKYKLKDDIYTGTNQLFEVNMKELDYNQQIAEINLKKAQIEAELKGMDIASEESKKLQDALNAIKALEERVAQDDLKNKKK